MLEQSEVEKTVWRSQLPTA